MKVDVFSLEDEEVKGEREAQGPTTEAVVEIMPQQPLGIMERAQIDMQIATAKQFPRSLHEALEKAKTLACYSPLIASQCTYAKPQGNKKIKGPSIRIAEIMATSWGNLRYGGRVLSVGERTVIAQGVCHDLETNVSVSVEVSRSIIDKDKHRYSDSMIVTTSMAAIAIGIRNAIFKIIPGAFVSDVLTSAQKVARGEDQGLENRLASALKFFEDQGIPAARVFISLGIKGLADATWEHIDTLLGYATSIRVEGIPITDIFPNTPTKTPEKTPEPPKPEAPEPPKPKVPETPKTPEPEATPTPEPTPQPKTDEPKPKPKPEPSPVNYAEAGHVLGQHGASWDMIYEALGLGDSQEVSEEQKTKVIGWARCCAAGESLESVLGLPPLQQQPGPPVGDQLFGKKAAEAAEAEAPKTPGKATPTTTQLDF